MGINRTAPLSPFAVPVSRSTPARPNGIVQAASSLPLLQSLAVFTSSTRASSESQRSPWGRGGGGFRRIRSDLFHHNLPKHQGSFTVAGMKRLFSRSCRAVRLNQRAVHNGLHLMDCWWVWYEVCVYRINAVLSTKNHSDVCILSREPSCLRDQGVQPLMRLALPVIVVILMLSDSRSFVGFCLKSRMSLKLNDSARAVVSVTPRTD